MSLKYAISPDERIGLLKKYIYNKGFIRVMEVHNGLSALIVQQAKISQNGEKKEKLWYNELNQLISNAPDFKVVKKEIEKWIRNM